MRAYFGNICGSEKAESAVFVLGVAVFHLEILGQGVAHAHDDAAFQLALGGRRIGHTPRVVGPVDEEDFSVVVDVDYQGSVAVGHMADGIGFVGAHGVRDAQEFAQKFSAFKVLQSFVPRDLFFFDDFFQRLFQLCGGAYRGLAGEHGLARCRGGAGIGGADSVRRLDKEDIRGKSCAFASHLQHDRGHALTDAGSAAAQMYLAFLNGGDAASGIGKAHAHAGIFEAGGNAGVLRLVKGFLDGLKAFHHSGTGVGYLSVGQGLPRPHGIAVADFPG